MDTDAGISRMLPPPVPKEEINDDQKIKERNVLIVLINKNDQLMVEGEPMHVSELKKKAKEFIENPADDPTHLRKKSKRCRSLATIRYRNRLYRSRTTVVHRTACMYKYKTSWPQPTTS